MSIHNIMDGFKVCGIYPFNQDAWRLPSKEKPKLMEALAEKSGLAYISLFSPAKDEPDTNIEVTLVILYPLLGIMVPHLLSVAIPLILSLLPPLDIIIRSVAITPLGFIDSHLSVVVPLTPPVVVPLIPPPVVPLTPPVVVPLTPPPVSPLTPPVVIPLTLHLLTVVVSSPFDVIHLDLAILGVIVPHQLDIIMPRHVDIIPSLSANALLPFDVGTF